MPLWRVSQSAISAHQVIIVTIQTVLWTHRFAHPSTTAQQEPPNPSYVLQVTTQMPTRST
jgi:hypothetical protein